MQIQLIRYFVTLAHAGHFRAAAERCGVTQPTLSSGIAALERQLGRRLIERDRRFIGLTPEGQLVLPWAQQMLAAFDAIGQVVEAHDGPLRGEFRLGAIPAALPVTGHVAGALTAAHPDLSVRIHSLTSREIEAQLAAFELDGGLTYLDHEPPAGVLTVPLYAERYVYVVHRDAARASDAAMPLAALGEQPLCLLHQGMQNRRILDAHIAERGMALNPAVLADSYLALLAMVQTGRYATIMPDSYVALLPGVAWLRALPFADPLPPSRIGFILAQRDPAGPLASAALRSARRLTLPKPFRG
jgi:DNA-binding transcriptional LysR family regulator